MQTSNWRERVSKLEPLSTRQAHWDLCEQVEKESIERAIEVVENELEIQKKVQEKSKEIVAIGRARVAGMVAEKYTRIGKIEALSELLSTLKTLLH